MNLLYHYALLICILIPFRTCSSDVTQQPTLDRIGDLMEYILFGTNTLDPLEHGDTINSTITNKKESVVDQLTTRWYNELTRKKSLTDAEIIVLATHNEWPTLQAYVGTKTAESKYAQDKLGVTAKDWASLYDEATEEPKRAEVYQQISDRLNAIAPMTPQQINEKLLNATRHLNRTFTAFILNSLDEDHAMRRTISTLLEKDLSVDDLEFLINLFDETDYKRIVKQTFNEHRATKGQLTKLNIVNFFLKHDPLSLLENISKERDGEALDHVLAYLDSENKRFKGQIAYQLLVAFYGYGIRHPEQCQHIIDHAAEGLNARNEAQKTPLMHFATIGDKKVCEQLIDDGADVDAQNSDGDDALVYAARSGSHDVVTLLLDRYPELLHRGDDRAKDLLRTALNAIQGYRYDHEKGNLCADCGAWWLSTDAGPLNCLLFPITCLCCVPHILSCGTAYHTCPHCKENQKHTHYAFPEPLIRNRQTLLNNQLKICHTLLDRGAPHDDAMREVAKEHSNALYKRMKIEANTTRSQDSVLCCCNDAKSNHARIDPYEVMEQT